MDDQPSTTPRNLNPSAEEFHPNPNYQNPTFITTTPIAYFPCLPLPPPQQQIFLSYPSLPFVPPPPTYIFFHLRPALPPGSVPQHIVAEQHTLFSNIDCTIHRNKSVFPARRPRSYNVGADSMSDALMNKDKPRSWRLEVRGGDQVIRDCGDSRTTLMIRNIPNKYSRKLFLSMLDNHCAHCNDQILGRGRGRGEGEQAACLSSYDFVYLPMDFINKCNVGYGFVNMTSPEGAMRLCKALHGQSWEVLNSQKICEVAYARVQGLKALKEHFRNSKFPSGSEQEIFPVIFDPPRDGRQQLTSPQPIYGLVVSASENGSDEQMNENYKVRQIYVEGGGGYNMI